MTESDQRLIPYLDYTDVAGKEEVKADDYEQLAREDLDSASPLEIMDRALRSLRMILQLLSGEEEFLESKQFHS